MLAFIASLLYLHVAVVRVAYIPTDSMWPTVHGGDRVLVRQDAYWSRSPRRGELVVYRTAEAYELKRVIAVAGDEIVIASGRVGLNGELLEEPYVAEPMIVEKPIGPLRVPEGHIFVMGDSHNSSGDSRDTGPVSVETVLGRATHVLLPLSRAQRLR